MKSAKAKKLNAVSYSDGWQYAVSASGGVDVAAHTVLAQERRVRPATGRPPTRSRGDTRRARREWRAGVVQFGVPRPKHPALIFVAG